MSSRSLAYLKNTLGGRWVDEAAKGRYDAARQVFNGDIDRRPLGIAFCSSLDEIRTTLEVAHAEDTRVTVRATGHNVAGRSIASGCIVIDVRLMKDLSIDPVLRRAVAGPGVTWARV